MNTIDAPTTYVRLGLAIDRLFEGYVDSYYGLPELRAEFQAGEAPSLADLQSLADSFAESLAADTTLAPDRRQFLSSELGAMRTTLRILGGDPPDIVTEVQGLYGVRPEWVDEAVFHDAHYTLDQVLPVSGPLARRVADFRERSRVPVEVAAPVVQQLADDLRERVRERFGLPEGEEFETAFVSDKPWYAYNWYLGELKSLIEINQEFALEVWDLPNVVAHEAYPGHHTEHAIKEHLLYRKAGRLEHSILLSNTPSSLISEGIATNALRAVASEGEMAVILQHIYKVAGLPKSDGERAYDFITAGRPLSRVTDNQVLLRFRDSLPEDEVLAYGMRYGLRDEKEARQLMRFLIDPLWRSYSFNYTLGRDLVAKYLDSSPDRTQAFALLLTEPLTPGQLGRPVN